MNKFLKLILLSIFAVFLCGLFVSPGISATIDLTGRIRDFDVSHPDMEGVISGLVTGLVNPTLAGDKNPDYIGTGGGTAAAGSIVSTDTFDQWYEDVAGVNVGSDYTITLDNGGSGDIFTYSSSNFFPLGAGNYHFTYEIHTQFTYQGGEFFEFAGDDDLWLFINDALVVDLGGVHPVENGGVNLDSVAGAIGLVTGNDYDFDLFFAERHTTQSNFRIDTSILLQEPVIPEPATMLLVGSGLLGMAVAGRKKFFKKS